MHSLRQGDVLLFAVDAIPASLAPVPAAPHQGRTCLVVAHGERTGHAHILPADAGITLFRAAGAADGGSAFIDVQAAGVELVHDQHRALPIPPGRYRVVMQRQYDPTLGAGLAVAD